MEFSSLALVFHILPNLVLADLASTRVEIEEGGYTGVVIAIHPDVQEEPELIHAIKIAFTDASRVLYIATGNRAYFKNITILVPKTWTNGSYDYARGSENYDQADAIIAPPNPGYGNTPYTVQHDGCGKPGIRMHFTPEYLRNETNVRNFGPRGKVVVHEWAHYRWGVFDETSFENPFYWDPEYGSHNGPVATTCPRDLQGEIRNVDSNYALCTLSDIEEETNSYPESCVFFPLEEQFYPINTSMMAYHYLNEVVTFCQDADDEDAHEYNRHNVYAPNAQNTLCSMQSTWKVIKSSHDYSQWTTGALSNVQEAEPYFDMVQTQAQRFVLILDDSGSMEDPIGGSGELTRTNALQMTANYFISVAAPHGSYVGMVTFGDAGTINYNLTQLLSKEDRDKLASYLLELDDIDSGWTCIGCGLNKGIEVLENGGKSAAGGHLIVITDGEETRDPSVRDVSEYVLSKGAIVDTIFIENDSNEDLKNLCTESGGVYYLGTSPSDLVAIFNQISISDSTTDNSFQIHSETFDVSSDNFESSAFIDLTIGLNTVFSFLWSKGYLSPYIVIFSPEGCVFSNNAAMVNVTYCNNGTTSHDVNVEFKTIRFDIPGVAKTGEWSYLVEKNNTGEMTSTVSSQQSNANVEPIMIESGMSQTNVGEGEAAIVYAKVTQGYNPILGAAVVGTVGDGTHETTIDLYDNGAGSDVRKDDGIYSSYFTEFTGKGRYSVEVSVKSGAVQAEKSNRGRRHSKANYIPGFANENGTLFVNPNGAKSSEGDGSASVGIQSQDLGNFTRVASSGSFDYTGTVDVSTGPPPDYFPPGRIIDLRLRQKNISDFNEGVVLEFTAPGDDYDLGQARGYIIRYTFEDPTMLLNDFDSTIIVSALHVLSGNMSDPSEAGERETFNIEMPLIPVDESGNTLENSRLAFAVRAFDDAKNYGDISNIAIVNFFIAPVIIPDAVATTTDHSTPETTGLPSTTMSAEPVTTTSTGGTATCEACEEKITFFTWLSSCLGVIAGIFLTSTVILGIWLNKSNKRLAKIEQSMMMRGVDNIKMVGGNSQTKKQELTKTQPRSNGNAYIDDFDF